MRHMSCLAAKSNLHLHVTVPAETHCLFSSILHRCAHIRCLSTTAPALAGHNKWSSIKHDKAKVDQGKAKLRTLFNHEIVNASRSMFASYVFCNPLICPVFGPDPTLNPRLADAIARAKKASVPKANIDAAIARGQGKSVTGKALEAAIEQGTLANVSVVVDILSDNKPGTMMAARRIFREQGGATSKVAYLFEKRGRLGFKKAHGLSEDNVIEAVIESGGLDVHQEHDSWIVLSELDTMKQVGDGIRQQLGVDLSESEIIWVPKDTVDISDETQIALDGLLERLLDTQGVKDVFTDAKK